jgi:hypothetical protein
MSHGSNYRTLISRGRKAGLSTRELYTALARQPEESTGRQQGQADPNGYVSGYNQQGQHIYRPIGGNQPS